MKKRNVIGCTIDPAGSIDLDDGLELEYHHNNVFSVGIPIAQATKYVMYDSPEMGEAYRRAESDYHDSFGVTTPMLSMENTLKASLTKEEKKPVILVTHWFKKTKRGWQEMPKDMTVEEAIFISSFQLTYEEANTILTSDGIIDHQDLREDLRILLEIAYYLQRKYSKSRSMSELNDGGSGDAHKLIEEFMLYTNVLLTKWCKERNIPILYRNHASKAFELCMDEEIQLREHIIHTKNHLYHLRSDHTAMIILPMRAMYNIENKGHYGLNYEAYAHFTSPIRRFSDLLHQYGIVAYLRNIECTITKNDLRLFAQHCNKVKMLKSSSKNHLDPLEVKIKTVVEKCENGFPRDLSIKEFTLLAMLCDTGQGAPFSRFCRENYLREDIGEKFLTNKLVAKLLSSGWNDEYIFTWIEKYSRAKALFVLLKKYYDTSIRISTKKLKNYVFIDLEARGMKKISKRGKGFETVYTRVLKEYVLSKSA